MIPALIMNARIKQRIDTEIDAAVFPQQGCEVGGRFVCEKRSSILISVGFDISCPSFDIAAGSDQIADISRLCPSEKNSLIQVPWKSLVRKSCKKLQIGVAVGTVDINYIGPAGIKRRGKIKCRTQEIFHGFVDIADFIISGIEWREILLHDPIQILKGRFWLKIIELNTLCQFWEK